MKKLVNFILGGTSFSEKGLSIALLAFRIFAGAMMIPFGITKIEKFDAYCINFFDDPIGIGMVPSLVLTIFAQVGCSITLMSGFLTRASAMLLAFNMLVACKYHLFDGFGKLALPLIYLGVYCLLSYLGGGKYSIDNVLFNKKQNA